MSSAALPLTAELIAAGCNRDPETADWNHALDLIAFAAGSCVCIYDPARVRIRGTLRGHDNDAPAGARIACVRWLPCAGNASGLHELVTGSADATVKIWQFDAESMQVRGGPTFVVVALLSGVLVSPFGPVVP